jgi:hypothetical protein
VRQARRRRRESLQQRILRSTTGTGAAAETHGGGGGGCDEEGRDANLRCRLSRGSSTAWAGVWAGALSHPVLEGKPNANHVRARISYSRTQQLHNMDIITQCSN